MIVMETDRGRRYVQLFEAQLIDPDGGDPILVKNRKEVVAFLKKHPDKEFELAAMPRAQMSHEIEKPDSEKVVFCGIGVKWDSKKKKLIAP